MNTRLPLILLIASLLILPVLASSQLSSAQSPTERRVFLPVFNRNVPSIITLQYDNQAFLDICPQNDPIYAKLRSDFTLRRDDQVVGEVPCSEPVSQMPVEQYSDELITLQALRALYYMDQGSPGYPWTSGGAYDWMASKVGGIDLRADGHWCCEVIDSRIYIIIRPIDPANTSYLEFKKTWNGIAGSIALFAHEARHMDGYGHDSGCGVPNNCDPTYDINNLGAFGIHYWLHYSWMMGIIDVGIGCMDEDDAYAAILNHMSNANGLRERFSSNPPPLLTMPDPPYGGSCR